MKNLLTRLSSFSFVVVLVALATGCGPRGESHTIEEIFTDARSAYSRMAPQVSPEVGASLKGIAVALDKIAGQGGGGDARQISAGLVSGLTDLLPKAGFTQRAAMSELIEQYRQISNSSGAPLTLGAANLKLIAARTYTLLSAELTSTQFRIS